MATRTGLLVLTLLAGSAPLAAQPSWARCRSPHFEVYSEAGAQAACSGLAWFEQLRLFFQQRTSLTADTRPPVRVIGFRSSAEYEPYRLRQIADAYFVATEARNYIVMPGLGARQYGMAAHEYAHLLMHAGGFRLPAWLSEGLAEIFSTVEIGGRSSTVGSTLQEHFQRLQRGSWIPLPALLSLATESLDRGGRDRAGMFYAESCALAHMLMLSPDYAPKFPVLVAALVTGVPAAEALANTYAKPVNAVAHDLHAWTERPMLPALAFPGAAPLPDPTALAEELSEFDASAMLADLLLSSGQLGRAEDMYRDLAREKPRDPSIAAALGAIALRRNDYAAARGHWIRAIGWGIEDASLCYRYAILAEDAGLPATEIRPALERAVALDPGFEEARYMLGLLEKNAGRYEQALTQLRLMRTITPARAFAYHTALASLLDDLGRHDEAKTAALQAQRHAANAEQRDYAAELAYIADTDLAVHFTRDAEGRAQLATTRAPRNTAAWNPFIEPGDQIRIERGTLREIQCGSATRFRIDTDRGAVTVAMPDPSRVQVRNGPSEFICGDQSPQQVTVEYNKQGILRGIEFR